MKATAAFRMEQQTKRSMARVLDPHRRGQFKRAMIHAQLQSSVVVRREKPTLQKN